MNKITPLIALALLLPGCNEVIIKPHTLNSKEKVFITSNGEHMQFAMKEELVKRGYNVTVGKTDRNMNMSVAGKNEGNVSTTDINSAKYIIKIDDYPSTSDTMMIGSRIICAFNGWNWYSFNVSVVDNKTGKELLAWSGMGCKDYAKKTLSQLLDELENK